jgi:hypothetical protein
MQQSFQHRLRYENTPPERQAFHNPHTSLGVAGHWIRTIGLLSPLIIGECIKDPDKKWRAMRFSSLATALVYEGLWARKLQKERDLRERVRREQLELMQY